MKTSTVIAWASTHVDEIVTAVEEDNYLGFCASCGDLADGVEPDARNYTCGSCGEPAVFGAEELLMYVA